MDFQRQGGEMVPPKLSHLIVNTSNYDATKKWYLDVLDAEIWRLDVEPRCMFPAADEDHRLVCSTSPKPMTHVSMAQPGFDGPAVARVSHSAFQHPTLDKLLEAYE